MAANQEILLVADTAFIDSKTIEHYNLLSVFPREVGDGAYRAVGIDNLLQRSRLQSSYYDALLPRLIPIFSLYTPSAGGEVGYFVRPVIAAVTSLFADRCVRVLHRIRQHQGKRMTVAVVEPVGDIQWLSDIKQSWRLNQEIIQRIMFTLGFEERHVFDPESYPEYPVEHQQRNLLFSPQRPGLTGVGIKLLNRYYSLLEHIPNSKARFQSLGFGVDQYYLSKRGLLGLFAIPKRFRKVRLTPHIKDVKLREDLFKKVEEVARPPFELLLSQLDPHIRRHELEHLSRGYVRILIDWFPIGFLEGLQINLEKVTSIPGTSKIVGIIGHDAVSDLGYFVNVSARRAGKVVIGVQHGGHYGYIEDMSNVGHSEYASYDKMITWGWTHIDSHLPQCETVPLPSPKLSECPLKFDYIGSSKSRVGNVRDILYLSNLWHRFPGVSTCGQSRVDFIDEIACSQEDLVRAAKNAGLTIDHKPYNMKFVDLYPDHYCRLEAAGGSGYRLLRSTQKGLTVDLIKTCRIVLWDQIGSGTLECFTSDVPTIVYWKRIYSRESLWARELVAGLERCGVVHSDAGELSREIKTYLADPEGWMADKDRKQAIRAFCQKFALTDPHWHESWKRQLLKWSMESSS